VSLVEACGWRYLEHIPSAVLVTPDDIQRAAPAFGDAGTVVIQLQQPAQTALAAAALGRQHGCRVVLDGAPLQKYRELPAWYSGARRANIEYQGPLGGGRRLGEQRSALFPE
jgi:hypothetical protein